jgi:hypothetical protein
MKGYQRYFIHNNGGRPYLVYINKKLKTVRIYKESKDFYVESWGEAEPWSYIELVKEYKQIVKIFVGKSPLNSMTSFSWGDGPEFDGNSILLQLTKQTYVYIGSEIYKFTTKDQIKRFISPVGNNDVPYPYAFGTKFCYFFLDWIKLSFTPFMKTKEFKDNPYIYYYGHQKFPAREKPKQMTFKIKNISKNID